MGGAFDIYWVGEGRGDEHLSVCRALQHEELFCTVHGFQMFRVVVKLVYDYGLRI